MICRHCGKDDEDVQERYSYGIYAGIYCDECAYDTYRDHCGLTSDGQGKVEDLDEFAYGGYDAIDGEKI